MKYTLYTPVFFLVAGLLWGGCLSSPEIPGTQSGQMAANFTQLDSLYLSGDTAAVARQLDEIRNQIAEEDLVSRSDYYYYRGVVQKSFIDRNRYADSALNLYPDIPSQIQYKNAYIKALILKCEVLIHYKRHEDALANYFKIRSLADPDKNPVAYADYNSRIAQLYYAQQHYIQAAGYHMLTYNTLQSIEYDNPQHLFYLRQGALNNAGFSYEQANMLDSAEYLYRKGIAYLKEEDEKNIVGKRMLNSSKIVFLDNLGGLIAKRGDLLTARNLLEQSIAINDYEEDRSKSTAYLKLADVYTRLGELEKANGLLDIVEYNLSYSESDYFQIGPRLTKAKSNLAAARGDYELALFDLTQHLEILDSIQQESRELSNIDLNLRFESFQDKKDIAHLAKANQDKTRSLVIVGMFLIMLIFIVLLTLKNAKQAKKAQNASIEHNEQLKKVIAQLETRNKEYAKIMKVMAHDLKNPLGGIVGISNELLAEGKLNNEQQELLQLISSSGANMLEMISELLNSDLVTENERLIKEDIDLQHLLQQCVELLQYKANEKQQVIHFRSGEVIVLKLSREKIWRVFNNLLVNAIKFSPANTKIQVTLERKKDSVVIAIIDNGIGVPPNDREKIFEMFTSAKRTGTAGEQPFGIGLSISKQIIESHGGTIWLKDNPEGGTIFFVELPIAR